MIQKIKTLILSVGLLAAFAIPVALPASSAFAADTATIQESLCKGANDLTVTNGANQQNQCNQTGTGGTDKVNTLIKQIINIFSVVVGLAAVIMIIVAGFRYVTSGGKDESVKGAKNTILYAIIGLVIVALAQVIVRFVLDKAVNP